MKRRRMQWIRRGLLGAAVVALTVALQVASAPAAVGVFSLDRLRVGSAGGADQVILAEVAPRQGRADLRRPLPWRAREAGCRGHARDDVPPGVGVQAVRRDRDRVAGDRSGRQLLPICRYRCGRNDAKLACLPASERFPDGEQRLHGCDDGSHFHSHRLAVHAQPVRRLDLHRHACENGIQELLRREGDDLLRRWANDRPERLSCGRDRIRRPDRRQARLRSVGCQLVPSVRRPGVREHGGERST